MVLPPNYNNSGFNIQFFFPSIFIYHFSFVLIVLQLLNTNLVNRKFYFLMEVFF